MSQASNGHGHGHSHSHSALDFRQLCQRLDVDSLKAKLPTLPALPQLKLPKALPKLRAHKIFRSSRENVAGAAEPGQKSASLPAAGAQLTVPASHAQFINHTPTRISTISSLMHEQDQQPDLERHRYTYRSAGSVDDVTDYSSRPISPVRLPQSQSQSQNPRQSLAQRLQRGYKDFSEFRLKHIFAKKTIVRRDNIEVQRYVEQYEEERQLEQLVQQRRDRQIADNYNIKFQLCRQSTLEDGQEREREAPPTPPPMMQTLRSSDDESGMEATPPARKPGIAATRFAKVRKQPLTMPEMEMEQEEEQRPPRSSSYKQRLKRLSKLPSLERKRQAPLSPQQSEERLPEEEAEQQPKAEEPRASAGQAIRQNIKRLHKSIKRTRNSQVPKAEAESEDEDKDRAAVKSSRSSGLTARLRRFRSNEEMPSEKGDKGQSLSDRLQQRLRRNFKQEPGGEEEEAESQERPQSLLQKLKHIRVRKASSQEEQEEAAAGAGAEEQGAAVGGFAQLEERFVQARQRTYKKVNEKMQQLKFFQRPSTEATPAATSTAAKSQPNPNTLGHEPVEIDDEELDGSYHSSSSEDDEEQQEEEEEEQQPPEAPRRRQRSSLSPTAQSGNVAAHALASPNPLQTRNGSGGGGDIVVVGATLTAWTTEPILCEEEDELEQDDSLDSGDEADRKSANDYSHVLIHQDHSDAYESKLIIAMTKGSVSPKPKSSCEWLPNEQIIASFRSEAAWQVQPPTPPLYKPRSIDIFEASEAFEADFEDALRNAPVEEVAKTTTTTTTMATTQLKRQIGNSRESLLAHMGGEPEESDDDDDDDEEDDEEEEEEEKSSRPPSTTPSPPPSLSPPPPPLPERRPPPPTAAPIYDAVPPPLPASKPPPVPIAVTPSKILPTLPPTASLPQRSSSMSRPSKPLVKTSSLRLTYNEQVRPGDVGKVNKLISRFEGPQTGSRPRLIARRLHSEEQYVARYSDDEEEEELLQPLAEAEARDATPTPASINRPKVIPAIITTQPINNNNNNGNGNDYEVSSTLSLDRQNSNCSRSEYGSPLAYPSSRRSSNNNTPIGMQSQREQLRDQQRDQLRDQQRDPQRDQLRDQQRDQLELLHQARRSRRSMTRDDDNFYSFDSDEENSYYSISPSGSSRYVVEI